MNKNLNKTDRCDFLLKITRSLYLSSLMNLEKEIGCKLEFRGVSSRYIDGWMSWNMTNIWKKFGLDIKKGANYFTMGKIISGSSARFDQTAPEYQSWLGGYTVKLSSQKPWTIEDHFKLAIADQNNWLKLYGDPNPATTIDGWKFTQVGQINIDDHSGILYEGGCKTHGDAGRSCNSLKLRLACVGMATLFNLSNADLHLRGSELRPLESIGDYKAINLQGYIVIVDIGENTKAVLYGNGTVDTFPILKKDLIKALKLCKIISL